MCSCVRVMFVRGGIIILLYTINILIKHIWAGKEELYTFILNGDQMRHMLAKSNVGSGGTSSLLFNVHDFKSSHFSWIPALFVLKAAGKVQHMFWLSQIHPEEHMMLERRWRWATSSLILSMNTLFFTSLEALLFCRGMTQKNICSTVSTRHEMLPSAMQRKGSCGRPWRPPADWPLKH